MRFMDSRVLRCSIIVAALLLCARITAAADLVSWTVDGVKRDALVFAPSSPQGKLPLIFSFHGHGDDMENFQFVGLQDAWPDAIVVYFQGLPSRDGYRGWQVEPGEYGDRDLKLVDAALAALKKKYNVDDRRIYATGFSNGAHFTYLLWATRPNVFAAYAPVAGRHPADGDAERAAALFLVGGARDAQVAFADQTRRDGHCDAASTASREKGSRAATAAHSTAAGTAAPVMTWIHQGGHEYPRPTSAKIVEFFHEHEKRN